MKGSINAKLKTRFFVVSGTVARLFVSFLWLSQLLSTCCTLIFCTSGLYVCLWLCTHGTLYGGVHCVVVLWRHVSVAICIFLPSPRAYICCLVQTGHESVWAVSTRATCTRGWPSGPEIQHDAHQRCCGQSASFSGPCSGRPAGCPESTSTANCGKRSPMLGVSPSHCEHCPDSPSLLSSLITAGPCESW
jgi:hypothetical protein